LGKIKSAIEAISQGNFEVAESLVRNVFLGDRSDKSADPGMLGSLIYHMAMVSKMEAESKILLETFSIGLDEVEGQLEHFYREFLYDVIELMEEETPELTAAFKASFNRETLTVKEKLAIITELMNKLDKVEALMEAKDPEASRHIMDLFEEWSLKIVEMRLRQEYETIKGFLSALIVVKKYGLNRLEDLMKQMQRSFGEYTVKTALKVSLKAGLKRDELDKLMLSDHYIERVMNMRRLEGVIRFLNCPIYGSYMHMTQSLKINPGVGMLFCRYFCFGHAQAMLNMVMPFPFKLTQSRIMAEDGLCEYHLKMGGDGAEGYVPLVISWNVTLKCNMKCPHCYINSAEGKLPDELNTMEAFNLIDQLAEVTRPLLILSGGEPLLRQDIFEIISYAKKRGFKVGLGSNGSLINWDVARRLKEVGVDIVSISLDSINPEKHDSFRGVKGAWEKAVNAIKTLIDNDVIVQVNTTITKENHAEISQIIKFAEDLGVENFHLFFLVPTGRAARMEDITPEDYEDMIRQILIELHECSLNVKFSCAPQFMRIISQTGKQMRHIQAAMRGCLAGFYYCRIYPNGDVTPCPYLPIKLGNIREKPFREIWFNSEVLMDIRNPDKLKGKCGRCQYRYVCGGCRARAYGLTAGFIDFCGDLHEPTSLRGDYMAEEPWCTFNPSTHKSEGVTHA